ncbi:hypothetical protein TTHERM_00125540 (macronuclear) [Tetrahymena thermophila SB210]|uniref:Uncharacterized protein n=1 Tax=Tetrahymena thermophila (strain SB210) TaxID=312017 RepID=I7M7U0_TETTS|nr:hypothetical protein TTHERM_00125540 [Tetrahymena thermophila SB210]EAR95988.2 hypothetical protein TTHERM_00125540 [Tetrahymena thermophila SB210]|eukprot:XP_001016233.2 hypothetical protein TTHERM_00125540 [Tetrahymena thermophila SB210]
MNYQGLQSLVEGNQEPENHPNKFEFDAYSTNVSAFGESMIQIDEINYHQRIIQEAEEDLNIERRKDVNQDNEKQKIEVQVYKVEQQKSFSEFGNQKHEKVDKSVHKGYSMSHFDDKLLQQPVRNKDHCIKLNKQRLEQKKQLWLNSKKYLFIESTKDLETSIWKKKVFNCILIDYQNFIDNPDQRADLKHFLEKETIKHRSINECHLAFFYKKNQKDYLIQQLNILKNLKWLSSITINLIGKQQEVGIKEKELYKVYFNKLSFKESRQNDCDEIDEEIVSHIIQLIQSNFYALKEIYISLPDIEAKALDSLTYFMNKEGFKNRKICHFEFQSSRNIDNFIDKLSNIPSSLKKLSLQFHQLENQQQQKLCNQLQYIDITNFRLSIGGKIEVPINEFFTVCYSKLNTYKLTFTNPISAQQFSLLQENFGSLPKQLNKFHLDLQVQDDNELILDPICFSHIPKTIQNIGISIHNNLNNIQTQNFGAIMTQLPIQTQSLKIEFNDCDTDIFDQCFSIEYVDLDKFELSIQQNLFPEEFTSFLKKIPSSTYQMKLKLRDYHIYDCENKNEYLLVLSQIPQKLNYIILDLGLLNEQNANILKQNIKFIKADLIIILAKYANKEAKSILCSISKSHSTEIKIHFY